MKTAARILFSVLAVAMVGCSTCERAGVEHHSAFSRHEQLERDSVFLRDSIVLKEKADTVFYTKYRTLYKEKLLRDTVFKCDTLFCEKTVTVEEGGSNAAYSLLILLPLLFLLWKSGVFRFLSSLVKNG